MVKKAVSIKNLYKNFGSLKAIDGISFDIDKGEFFGYLGPNGAGKTTTINVMTGLANPTSGTVKIFGNDVLKNYQQARMQIGLAPQDFNFDIFMTVEEVLHYGGGYYGKKGKDLDDRVELLLKNFGLREKYNEKVRHLSGGMKRRLQLAKALVHEPKLLILDEPTAGVDVELRRALWDYLNLINKEGTTIMLTTHYIEEAEKLCDRIGIIHKGKLVAIDHKENLIQTMSKQTILITLANGEQEIADKWAGHKAEFDKKTMKLTFECEKAQECLPHILESLTKEGVKIEGVEMIRTNLEDIFIKLTGAGHGSLDRV